MNSNTKIIYKKDNTNSVYFRRPSLKNLKQIYKFTNKKNFNFQLKKTIEFYAKKK